MVDAGRLTQRSERAGEVQLTYGGQCGLPSAVGAQPADPGVLIRQSFGIQTRRPYSVGQNKRGVGPM
jgi:hypothetical protein